MNKFEPCASCGHFPSRHDGEFNRPCDAYSPDTDDRLCACPGWKTKAPAAVPQPPIELQRKDLHE